MSTAATPTLEPITLPKCEFDPEKHIYYDENKAPVISVTQVFSIVGLCDFSMIRREVLERKQDLGVAVHEATRLLDRNDLSWGSLDDDALGYVSAYEKFMAETQCIWRITETPLVLNVGGMRYGMSCDREGYMPLRGKMVPLIMDIKTPVREEPYWALQTAAYDMGLTSIGVKPADGGPFRKRMILQLKSDGEFELHHHEDRNDYSVFRGMLATSIWKRNNGYDKS